ncbi:MAG: hypothetical protein OXF06_13380 [Bacteroidetes bacterium]|nr:hypothetical protein [Bacteroidota bacterium]MCY4225810.1 hypothetical protein [Bacteroidota bacterium]
MNRSNPLGRLFARYLDGQIDESVWTRFLSTLETYESNPSERSAMISFFDDLLGGSSMKNSCQLNRLLSEAI